MATRKTAQKKTGGATAAKTSAAAPKVTLLGTDRVVVEFRINDLLRQLKIDPNKINPVAACSGCDSCS